MQLNKIYLIKKYSHKLIGAIAVTILLAALPGCKTTEENYRTAYEAAKNKQDEGFTADELSRMTAEEAIPRTIYKGDSIPLRGMYFNTVKLTDSTPRAKRYNVVAGRFRQKFNAESALARAQQNGYPDALLLIDVEQHFLLDLATTDTLDTAVAALRQIEKKPPFPLSSPFPYIINRATNR